MFADRRPLHLPLGLTLLLAATLPAVASPFWVAYEGDDYPENQGWQRVYGDENGPYKGGAVRSLADGVLTSDGLRNNQIFDYYYQDLTCDPGPGETFVAEWRVRIDPRSGAEDVGVGIFRASSPAHAYFYLGPSAVEVLPGEFSIGLAPDQFHAYRFESPDMVHFTLTIDDTIGLAGIFDSFTVNQGAVGFGDDVQGQRSLAQWDYFRYGIVPEPASGFAVCLAACFALRHFVRAGRPIVTLGA
jgi:hypothetical protein